MAVVCCKKSMFWIGWTEELNLSVNAPTGYVPITDHDQLQTERLTLPFARKQSALTKIKTD
jgi:hypothetical protein